MGVNVRFWKGAWWVFVNHQGKRKAKRIGDRETALRVASRIRPHLAEGPCRESEGVDDRLLHRQRRAVRGAGARDATATGH